MKKPKLSKEERKARRLARREERRLKKIQRDIQARKDELDREAKATDINARLINDKWREIMSKIRGPMLYDDFLTLRQRNERLMDMKNLTINELMEALDETNDQYNSSLQHHVETIDKLLDIYTERIDALSDWYRNSLMTLGESLSQQKNAIQEVQRHDETVINMVMFGMEDNQAENSLQRRAEFTVKMDEETVKCAEAYHTMQTRLEAQLERQLGELRAALQEHQDRTADTRAAVARLQGRERAEHRVIAEQRRRTRQLHRLLEEGRELARSWDVSEAVRLLRVLRAERDELRAAYLTLRQRMARQRAHDARQLGTLVLRSEGALQKLQCTAARGEKILALARLCRSREQDESSGSPETLQRPALEPEQEPGPGLSAARCPEVEQCPSVAACFGQQSEDLRSRRSLLEEGAADLIAEAVGSLEGLQRFWARAGEAQLAQLQLRAEVEELRAQNEHLHLQLRHYLRAVAPTASGPDPIPRGPPCVPVYEPAVRAPGTTPWRGIRGIRAVGQ